MLALVCAALTVLRLTAAPTPALPDSGGAPPTLHASAPPATAIAPASPGPASPTIRLAAAGGPRVVARFDAERAWALEAMPVDTPPPVRRPRAIVHSDAYYTRLTIHRFASYAILPLFAGEYIVGKKILDQEPQRSNLRGVHTLLGVGIFAAFGANTVTGVWNLTEARHDPGAARRTTHAVLMLLADAGFAATAATIPRGHREFGTRQIDISRARAHRDIAIGSIALGTIGSTMMWFWK